MPPPPSYQQRMRPSMAFRSDLKADENEFPCRRQHGWRPSPAPTYLQVEYLQAAVPLEGLRQAPRALLADGIVLHRRQQEPRPSSPRHIPPGTTSVRSRSGGGPAPGAPRPPRQCCTPAAVSMGGAPPPPLRTSRPSTSKLPCHGRASARHLTPELPRALNCTAVSRSPAPPLLATYPQVQRL
jgi:hypothetical protein